MKIRMQQILSDSTSARQSIETRYKLLGQIKREVENRLAQSLHQEILRRNKLHGESELTRIWDIELKIDNLPSQKMPPDKPLRDIFDLTNGQIVILGAAGAGKTTSLLELAADLIERAYTNASAAVPVPLNLCSWNQQQSLFEWLLEEVYNKYGLMPELGKKWLQKAEIIPLLDGFSELKTELHQPCLQAINQFIEHYQPPHLIVCCGIAEYALTKTLLLLNSSLYFFPLTELQIKSYLLKLGLPSIWQQLETDPFLLNWAKTPLFCNIIILSIEEIWLDEWRSRTSPEARCRYLLDAFIRAQLKQQDIQQWYGSSTPPTVEQTKTWLGHLAKYLKRQSLEELAIERIQPNWLTTPLHRWFYHLGVALIIGSIGAISAGLSFGKNTTVFGGILFGLLGGISFKIEPAEPINWSWKQAIDGVTSGLCLGLICSVLLGIILSVIEDLNGQVFDYYKVIIGGLIGGGLVGLSQGLKYPQIKIKNHPNQGIWNSALTAVIFTLMSGIIFSLSFGIFGGFKSGLGGFGFAILTGLACGGIACIQHIILRSILYGLGYIPWNYARFLNSANALLFLQRAGGRYHFIHDLLRANFAAPPLGEIVLRKTSTAMVHTVAIHADYVQAVAITNNGKIIASGSDDRTIKLWQINSKNQLPNLHPILTLSGHLGYVRALAISPDNQVLASGSNDKTIKLWHLGGVAGIPQGTLLFTLNAHKNWVRSVAFSPNGQLLASSGDDKIINIWYVPTGQLLNSYQGHLDYIRCLTFSPDGKYLVTGSDDATVNIWEIDSHEAGLKPKPYLTLEGNSGYVRCLAIAANGQFLASGSDDQTITIWQLAEGDFIHPPGSAIHLLGGHNGPVLSLAIAPDGQTLASCSKDKTIKIWRIATGQLIKTISLDGAAIFSIIFSPDGRFLIGGSQDKSIKLLVVDW